MSTSYTIFIYANDELIRWCIHEEAWSNTQAHINTNINGQSHTNSEKEKEIKKEREAGKQRQYVCYLPTDNAVGWPGKVKKHRGGF